MNPIIQSLHDRKSVRLFTEQPISPEDKQAILLAATAAPTAGNQQLYTILDITDQKLKEHLAVTCDDQPFIAKAKLVLIFCADCQKWQDTYALAVNEPRLPGAGDLLLALADTFIAAQNAVTAAQSLGIGSCYIGDILELCEEHRTLLRLPSYVIPAALLVFGYPTEQQRNRPKPARCDLSYIVHENGYHRLSGAELRQMLAHESPTNDFEGWCRAFYKRKYDSDFAKEMTRSVQKYLEPFQK